jgi:hypothetical protein
MADEETVPDIDWAGAKTITDIKGDSRQRLANAAAALARELIPELRRQEFPADSVIQLRMLATWNGTNLNVSQFFIEHQTTSVPARTRPG